jgi:hypothetical protein
MPREKLETGSLARSLSPARASAEFAAALPSLAP